MDLTLSDEQEALRSATADWCRDNMPLDDARARPADLWPRLDAMGWSDMTAPAIGLDHATEAVVFVELGRALAPVGLIASAAARRWFATGTGGRTALALPPRDGDTRVLDPVGAQSALLWQPGALRLFDLSATLPSAPTIDLSTRQSRIAMPGSGPTAAGHAPLHVQLLASAYAVGCAEAARDMAAGYARMREQFDRPIGWFQALKHICSDMAVRTAVARSQLYFASCALDEGSDAAFHVAAARRLAGQAALDNGRANIQVHGGIGMTDEASPHLCLKRAHLLEFIAPADASLLIGTDGCA